MRGGDRVLTHRLSNGFQRPTTTRLCAVRGLIRSDGSPRLDSVKAAPRLSDGDMDSQPPPRTPTTWEMSGKKSRQKTGKKRMIQRERREPENSIQAETRRAHVPPYCSVCFMIVYQIECVTFNRTPEPLEKPIPFVQ